ncbi:OsmC family protein [Ideonella sp.]|uniref:OsmC family protein n=1 Tax=Ideonella sp. TaxID=1929293 RepID=UPI0035AF190B
MNDTIQLDLVQQENYRFEARFDNPALPALTTDEPPPLGADAGPNPTRLLTTAVANCLSASLLFAMRKFKNEPGPLHTHATTSLVRNEQGRLRVGGIAVTVQLGVPWATLKQPARVLSQFEEFCVVTQSVRAAIPVEVRVVDSTGAVLPAGEPEPTTVG